MWNSSTNVELYAATQPLYKLPNERLFQWRIQCLTKTIVKTKPVIILGWLNQNKNITDVATLPSPVFPQPLLINCVKLMTHFVVLIYKIPVYMIHLKDPFVVDTLIQVGHGLKQRTQKICGLGTVVVLVTQYTVCSFHRQQETGGVLISINRCLIVKGVLQNHPNFLEKVYSSQYVWVFFNKPDL